MDISTLTLPYDNVSYTQLTKSKWIKQNSVSNKVIQKLLTKFNIKLNINEMTPILNQQQQNGTTPATGRTYYVNHLEHNPKGNWIFNTMKHDWTDYKMYNMKMNKWKLLFLYNYKGTLHQCDHPRNDKQFKNIKDAIEQVNDGKYIYHEDPYYIPFDKFNDRVLFNNTDGVRINEIKPKLNENVWIASNIQNYLAKEQYNSIYSMASSMFIDPKTNTYRDEYIINNIQTIPHYFWEKVATFARLFNQFQNKDTFMLLDESGRFGTPVGIDRNKNEIILNDRTRMNWTTFKTQFNQQNLIKYQNLDFQGLEYKLTQNLLDRHYIPPAQQIARVDLIKASKSLILQYMIGQYVLLDNGQDQFLPIYILSPTIVQSCAHLVHIEDINEYVIQQPGAQIAKSLVKNGNVYTALMVNDCSLDEKWKDTTMPNRPNIENIVESKVNGITNPTEANIISSAVSNALNHTTDNSQFSQILNNLNNQNNNSPKVRSAPNSPQLQSQLHYKLKVSMWCS